MESDWSVNHGPYSEFGDLLTLRGAQYMGSGYNIPNIRGMGRTVCTNHAWGGRLSARMARRKASSLPKACWTSWRPRWGWIHWNCVTSTSIAQAAPRPLGKPPEVFSLPQMIDLLRPKYQAAKEKAARQSTPEKKKGVGVSIGIYGAGGDGPDTAEVWAELTEEGVPILIIWEDHGQGANAGMLGTAHEALRPLGIAPDKIKLELNDTGRVPDGGPAGDRERHQVCV